MNCAPPLTRKKTHHKNTSTTATQTLGLIQTFIEVQQFCSAVQGQVQARVPKTCIIQLFLSKLRRIDKVCSCLPSAAARDADADYLTFAFQRLHGLSASGAFLRTCGCAYVQRLLDTCSSFSTPRYCYSGYRLGQNDYRFDVVQI